MKTTLKIAFIAILTLCLAISSYALPTTVTTVESVDEVAENTEIDNIADIYSEYVPSPEEFQQGGQYGEVIVWENFETYEEGTVISGGKTAAVYVNSQNASGITGVGIPRGTICVDTASGKKYVNCTANMYLDVMTPTDAKPGRYTIVVEAKRNNPETTEEIDVVVRGTKNGATAQNIKYLPSKKLTDSFETYTFSYDYSGYTAEIFLNQFLIRRKDNSTPNLSIDSFSVYYKPFDNYERPEFGNVICWEGYENRNIGETAVASNYSEIYNENNGSNLTNCKIVSGVVSAIPSNGLRYVTAVKDNYVTLSNGYNAKRGTYTAVIRARTGTASKVTVIFRTPAGTTMGRKTFTLTEEFEEYSLSYDYEPDTVNYLGNILVRAGGGASSDAIEVDSFALYYKPFDYIPTSYDGASIRVVDPSGVRFKASVTSAQKAQASEYGFVVTLKKHLGDAASDTLTIDSEKRSVGVSFGYDPIYDKSVDRVFATDDDNIFFTVVLIGIPATKNAYEDIIVVRPYLKNTDGEYYYGTPVERSAYKVASAIRDAGYPDLDEDSIAYVEGILNICEA